MTFKLFIEPEAFDDIQQAVDWYNLQQKGLGKRFYNAIKNRFKSFTENPFFAIRYDNVRCVAVEKFPYLIHYVIDEANLQLTVFAIINTSRNPEIWSERKNIFENE